MNPLREPAAWLIAALTALVLGALWRRLAAHERRVASTSSARPGAQVLQCRHLDLRTLLQALPRVGAPMLRSARIRLEVRAGDVPLRVAANPTLLRALMLHLLRLCAHAMPDGGLLRLRAHVEGDGRQVVLCLLDQPHVATGEALARLFERAASAHAPVDDACAQDQRFRAIAARRITAEHGGRLYAAHSALGGLGLTLRLPALRQPPVAQSSAASPPSTAAAPDTRFGALEDGRAAVQA